jgi:heme-degrading monooxygenase HmoA
MILEVAVLNIKPGQEVDFELAFSQAQTIISDMQGYISHELKKCIEKPSRYILLVNWSSLQDHTEGFRKSVEYDEWRRMLHHFYDPFPEVEHYTAIYDENLS